MTKSGFFNFQGILGKVTEIPSFYQNIIYYLAFIIVLEVILRGFDMILSLFRLEEVKVGEAELDEAELKPPKKV